MKIAALLCRIKSAGPEELTAAPPAKQWKLAVLLTYKSLHTIKTKTSQGKLKKRPALQCSCCKTSTLFIPIFWIIYWGASAKWSIHHCWVSADCKSWVEMNLMFSLKGKYIINYMHLQDCITYWQEPVSREVVQHQTSTDVEFVCLAVTCNVFVLYIQKG